MHTVWRMVDLQGTAGLALAQLEFLSRPDEALLDQHPAMRKLGNQPLCSLERLIRVTLCNEKMNFKHRRWANFHRSEWCPN